MILLQSQPLFKIGDFEVTLPTLVYTVWALIILIAIISYRRNHRIQTRVSRYMDNESGVFNYKGLEKKLSKKWKSFSDPTAMVIEIRNLEYLYSNYPYQSRLIYNITDVILSGFTKKEIAARIEFNKFIVVLEKRNKENVKNLCLKIQENLDALELEEYGKFDFYVYFGIYESAPLNDENILLYTSEIINYSKISIANIYYYSIEVKEAIEKMKRMNMEKDYDFEQHRFIPYVQPKVDLRTGRVTGGEILVRWVDESLNYKYPPSEFIPLFEKNGFVAVIDEEMFRQACLLSKVLVNKGYQDIKISVNVSKLKFLSPGFEQSIINIVNETQTNPRNVVIEVTETTVMENFQYVSNCIMKLRQFGFSVAMDDFGQEYSSLGALSVNPFDIIKLDRVFFKNKLATEKDRLIVRNLLDMLNDLNYTVVCEGISDKQTLDMLATINQDVIIQGYVISQPIPVSQFEAFLDTVYEFNYPPVDRNALYGLNASKTETNEEAVDYVDIQPQVNVVNPTLNSNNDDKLDEVRRQMLEMERKFQQQLEIQRRESQEAEMKRMRDEMLKLQELSNKPRTSNYSNDELESLRKEISNLRNESKKDSNQEIESLRREIEALRYQNMLYNKNNNQPDYHRDDEMYRLRREIYDMKYQQDRERERERYDRDFLYETNKNKNNTNEDLGEIKKQIKAIREKQDEQDNSGINDLISKVSNLESLYVKNNNNTEQAEDLRSKLEKERAEKEELERLLVAMQNQKKASELEKQSYNFDLDLSHINDEIDDEEDIDDEFEDEFDDGEEVEELSSTSSKMIQKPKLSLEELEAIVGHYKNTYGDNWQEHAKEDLKEGYYNLINDILYYQNKEKASFNYKLSRASSEMKQIYNIVKNELMKYSNVSNRPNNSYDCFYIGRNQIAKISFTSKKVRLYLAVNPSDYPEHLFPHKDLSNKKVHARTPYYTVLKSQLSVRRINKIITDMFAKENIVENQHYKPVDYATKLIENYKSVLF